MSTTTIVLADDHHVVRQGLRALFASQRDFAVTGEVADGREVAGVVERVKPHVLVLDLMMPGLNGLEVIRQVRRRAPDTRIVVLSMHANEAYVVEALRSGASAYVVKSAHAAEVVKAAREVMAGRCYLSPPLSEGAIEEYAAKTRGGALDIYETLTPREREVLHLAAEGYGNPEIATRLAIGVRTAESHRANLMHKLGLRSQTDVVRYALNRGILPAESRTHPPSP
jgi:DNA-binding NarL/FixJ family response regulator